MKSWKLLSTWALILTIALSLAACGSKEEGTKTPTEGAQVEQSDQGSTQESKDLKTTYPFTIKDATGEEFTFDKAPEKIVSVSPAETESLFALGLDQQIVGVSDYDDYPEAAKSKTKMGSITKPNEEAVIAANADIVFTGISMKEESVKKLRDLGIKIFKVEPKTLEDIMKNIEVYGQITDRQAEAQQVITKMKAERDQVVDAVKSVSDDQKKKVYIEFSPGWTVGKGEFMDELITLAGGVNVASDVTGWAQINEENIIHTNPDVILFANDAMDYETKKPIKDIILGRSGWDQITAIKNSQVIGLDGNLLSRPGPRLTEGLISMAKAIYPDLVK
ncbi:cobalamin-binding protein [Paenibacillus selenitireducens]|uniref:Cobalamin-binding protein n=1 Tax=Paenibacillus selenitireducens TaxID=1324314 RepID=A0A1T2XAN9_9BACL|nr:ABC transporter substrate-binding protein [Paenibacillus selenitireducens]OPA76900.1 cobalamin-binding protein [Paenibacillus selenitireducens]